MTLYSNRRSQYSQVTLLLRVYYLYCAISVFILTSNLAPFLMSRQDEMLSGKASLLFWWMPVIGVDLGCIIIFLGSIISSFLAAAIVGSQVIRVIQSIFLIHTTWWWWIFVVNTHDADKFSLTLLSILLAMIPSFKPGSKNRIASEKMLTGFVAAQAGLLLCYTMAGIAKLRYTLMGDLSGGYGVLQPYGMAIRIFTHIKNGYYSPELSPLAHFMGTNPWLTWIGILFFFAVQFSAILILHIPYLHRLYAIALIVMHCSICLFFNIHYYDNIFLIYLFLFLSPFATYTFRLPSISQISHAFRRYRI